MILKVYEYDNYDHSWGNPVSYSSLSKFTKNNNLPPIVQVGTYEESEYQDGHIHLVPVAKIVNGKAKLVWEDDQHQVELYAFWLTEGKDHRWDGKSFYRRIEIPIWGFEITTLEELELILRVFEEIAFYDDEFRIKN